MINLKYLSDKLKTPIFFTKKDIKKDISTNF